MAQITNKGFESWESCGNSLIPAGWGSTNIFNTDSFHSLTPVSDSYPSGEGQYAVRLENRISLLPNYGALGIMISGELENPYPSFQVIGHPMSMSGYFKFIPQNNDTLHINIKLFYEGIPVASGEVNITDTVLAWDTFKVDLPLYEIADSGQIIIATYFANGPQTLFYPHGNSVAYLDNLSLDTDVLTDVSTNSEIENIAVFPNPANTEISIIFQEQFQNCKQLTILSHIGQIVLFEDVLENMAKTKIDVSEFETGLYWLYVTDNEGIKYSKKLLITK